MSSFRTPQTIVRRLPGGYVDGRWVDGADDPNPVTILASVQPARQVDYDQMMPMREGRRIEALVRIYTDAVLKVAGADNSNGDRLVWPYAPRPGEYLVIDVSPWQSHVIPHYRYLAALEVEP
jgi:hypothetical protein